MNALILAAGKGTRLQDLTLDMPKPMLPVGNRPLLAHTVAWLRRHNVRRIAMNLHHAPDKIVEYFGDGERFGVEITYSRERDLLGTAGAAKRLEDFFTADTTEPFVVVYGDVYTNLDLTRLLAYHRQVGPEHVQSPVVTLALYSVPNPTECGLVEIDPDGAVERFVEKPAPDQVFTDLANAGILVCDPAVLSMIPAGCTYDFAHDLFPLLLGDGYALRGLPIDENEFVIDIGTPGGYRRAQARHLITD